MRLTSSGLANALSSGLAGFLSSGQQFTRASQALLENTVNAINGGSGPEEQTLENGEDVLITGLGKFQLRQKSSRPGRDPKNKQDYTISARQVVTFRPSKVWRDEINGKVEISERIRQKKFNFAKNLVR